MIRRIATDRENRYAVTASDDKTAPRLVIAGWPVLGRAARADRRRQYGQAVRCRDDAGRQHGGARRVDERPRSPGHILVRSDLGHAAAAPLRATQRGRPPGLILERPLPRRGIEGIQRHPRLRCRPRIRAAEERSGLWEQLRLGGFRPAGPVRHDLGRRLYSPLRDRKHDKPIAKVKGRGGEHPFAAILAGRATRVVDTTKVPPSIWFPVAIFVLKALDTSGIAENEISSTGWSNDGRYLFACGKGVRSGAGRRAGPAGTLISRPPMTR